MALKSTKLDFFKENVDRIPSPWNRTLQMIVTYKLIYSLARFCKKELEIFNKHFEKKIYFIKPANKTNIMNSTYIFY